MLTLENFEQELDSTILQRGRDYYHDGQVGEIEYAEGVWTALVYGSDEYEVEIEQQALGSLTASCTCPYEYGPYCKHIAAVLYTLRTKTSETPKSKQGSKSSGQTVREVIESLSREDLQTILLEVVKKDKNLSNSILLRYSKDQPQKQTYVQVIQDALRSVRRRDGFIEYRDMRRAVAPVYQLLDQATQLVKDSEVQKALPILQAIIETMVPALQYGDDSDGEFGGTIEEAFNVFDDVVNLIKQEEKPALFQYFLEQALLEVYDGWDYNWNFLHLAADLVATPEERTRLFEVIDRKTAGLREGRFDDFQRETAVEIKLEVMERMGDSPEARHALLTENINLNRIRQRLIAQYIAEGKLNTARKWVVEAIKQYQAERQPGFVHQYQQYLLHIAEAEDDTLAAMDIARDMFLNTKQFEYYDTLKRIVPTAEWPEYRSKLIKKIGSQPSWGWSDHLLAVIYERERMWPELMELAKRDGIRILDRYKEILHSRYPAESVAIYEEAVYELLKHAGSRDAYERSATYLNRMKSLGWSNRVTEIVDDLKARYPRRRALHEALDKLR